MKIYPGPRPKAPIVEPGKSKNTSTGAKTSHCTFETILNEKKRAMAPERPTGVTRPGEFTPVSTIQRSQERAWSYASESLELLDHFQRVLTRGGIPADKVLPYVEDVMHERINGLMTLRDELSPDDPLRETVNDVGVKIAVEAYKIHRGDYSNG